MDDLLRSPGLMLARDFLPADLCAQLREEAAGSTRRSAWLFRGQELLVDERVRRAKGLVVSGAAQAEVEQRLAEIMPALGHHFRLTLTAWQPLQFLAYDRGSFFRLHRDNPGEAALPAEVRARLVSAVVLLGRQTRLPEVDSYCGGALTFFRLPGGHSQVRTEVWGEEGLLVAFPANTLHEVRPVTHGARYSLVTWFTGPEVAVPKADGS